MAIGDFDPVEMQRRWAYLEALAWWRHACQRMAGSIYWEGEEGCEAQVEDKRGRKWRFCCELVKE